MTELTCNVPNCGLPVKARGWCSRHYNHWWSTGSPTIAPGPVDPATIPSQAGEEWRAVVGWEENYCVSNMGRVWSRPREKTPGGILAATVGSGGYRKVELNEGSDRRADRRVHLLVAEAFIGPRPPGMRDIRHLDGDPSNNRVSNLRYGTHSENAHDGVAHGVNHNANKTHCPRGHAYTEDNIYRPPSKPRTRGCRRCRKEEAAKRYLARTRQAA